MCSEKNNFIFKNLIGTRNFSDYIIDCGAREEFILYLNFHFNRYIFTQEPFHPGMILHRKIQFSYRFLIALVITCSSGL